MEENERQALAFRLLNEAQAWDIKGGSITLHFDVNGIPLKIEKKETFMLKPDTLPPAPLGIIRLYTGGQEI